MELFEIELPESEDVAADLEEQVMELIINSGNARSLAYMALACAKCGEISQAEEKMQEARDALNGAHLVQTKLIEQDQGEGKTKMTLIMVHAQDHLMTSMLARELISEMIELYKRLSSC
ncbi:N,N'-diacetylchitobiose-specific phosphotransferase enzyme IIA component [compost metagenome]